MTVVVGSGDFQFFMQTTNGPITTFRPTRIFDAVTNADIQAGEAVVFNFPIPTASPQLDPTLIGHGTQLNVFGSSPYAVMTARFVSVSAGKFFIEFAPNSFVPSGVSFRFMFEIMYHTS
jgi:hypothetical protein